jgi:hypothetical protein
LRALGRRRRPRRVGPYLAQIDQELAAVGVGFRPPHAMPFEGSTTLGLVDARVEAPGRPDAVVKVFEFINTELPDDPRETYSYRLVIDGRQVLGWDRDGVGPDHSHRWSADNLTIDHPTETVTRDEFLRRVVDHLESS